MLILAQNQRLDASAISQVEEQQMHPKLIMGINSFCAQVTVEINSYFHLGNS
jgi:hypothetical protein